MLSPELSRKISSIQEQLSQPVEAEPILTPQQVAQYVEAKLWSWEPDLQPTSPHFFDALCKGLHREPIGFFPVGLRIDGQPSAITIFKRYSPQFQSEFPVLIPNGELHNPGTVLQLTTLADITQGTSVIELADTQIKKNGSGKLGLYTPLRHGKVILQSYLQMVLAVEQEFPNDHLMAVPMGVFPWTAASEKAIADDIAAHGGTLTVEDYLSRYNQGDHYIPNAQKSIGKVRTLSKMSQWLVEKAGFHFEIVGYSPGDFGWICLTK